MVRPQFGDNGVLFGETLIGNPHDAPMGNRVDQLTVDDILALQRIHLP